MHVQQKKTRFIAIKIENVVLKRQINENIIVNDEMLKRKTRAISKIRKKQKINDDIDREQIENEVRINNYNFRFYVIIK